MPHPLVTQLRFARSEFLRGVQGISDEEARRRFLPMNCISWNVGHLAWQEQRYWLQRAQNITLLPEVASEFAYGAPASTPSLASALAAHEAITRTADPWLDALTTATLVEPRQFPAKNGSVTLTFGTLMLRTIYHYWYHTGENQAIRQMLGHTGLPDFVGDIDSEAPYRPEA
ncbi:MAG: DinB family protein [Anaerolineae bacterium]|nr:DinB family protein [Anaerolineae bacterium]